MSRDDEVEAMARAIYEGHAGVIHGGDKFVPWDQLAKIPIAVRAWYAAARAALAVQQRIAVVPKSPTHRHKLLGLPPIKSKHKLATTEPILHVAELPK